MDTKLTRIRITTIGLSIGTIIAVQHGVGTLSENFALKLAEGFADTYSSCGHSASELGADASGKHFYVCKARRTNCANKWIFAVNLDHASSLFFGNDVRQARTPDSVPSTRRPTDHEMDRVYLDVLCGWDDRCGTDRLYHRVLSTRSVLEGDGGSGAICI